MHIPDNYLSPTTCAVLGAAMIPVWATAIKKVQAEITSVKMPQLGIGAAFTFLVMMFNVPIPGGTTAHAIGGTLIAVLLGPYAAVICLSIALLLQALLFGDGGILAFGANAFNMAFALPFVGYFVYKFIKDRVHTPKGEYIGLAAGAYLGIIVAALCTAIEFGIQPLLFKTAAGQPLYCPYPLSVSIPAMLIPHLTIAGLAEVFFTVSIFAFIKKVSPNMIFAGSSKKSSPIMALIVALVCLTPLGLLATGSAWGEWSPEQLSAVVSNGRSLGFVPMGMQNGFHFNALFQDYSTSGLPDFFGYILSAVIGAALLIIIFRVLSGAKKEKATGAG